MRKFIVPLLWFLPLCFLALFYFYPMVNILSISLGRAEEGVLSPFLEIFHSNRLRQVIGFTFFQATLSTFLTLLLGLPIAYIMAHYQFRGKVLIQTLSGIPFVMPTLVVAAAFNSLLGPRGFINQGLMSLFDFQSPPIQFTHSLTAILVAHVFYNTTIVLRTVGNFWSHLDPRLVQAAQVLGASRWQAIRQVSLPLLAPVLVTAALLVFLFDFTSFAVILILGGPRFATIETEIYNQTVSLFNLPLAAALGILQIFFTLIITALYTYLANRQAQPLSLRPGSFIQHPFKSWHSRLVAAILIGFLLLLMLAPLISLAVRSLTRFEVVDQYGYAFQGFTVDYYRELTINRRESLFYASPFTSISISLGYASLTVILALIFGLPAAWALARDAQSAMNRLLDPLLMLPLGTSAVTLGLGFITALDQPPLDLRASPLMIPLAHTLVAFPFVVRNLTPVLRSIRPRLRQAASVLGASPWQVVKQVELPLIGRALLVAAIFAFAISMGEFGATALLARPEFPTIPVAIFRLLAQPAALFYGQAMALSTILMVVTASGMLLIEHFRKVGIGEF